MSSVGRKSNAIFALPGHRSTSSVGRKSNAIFGRKLKIDMAAYGWKVRTSPRRTIQGPGRRRTAPGESSGPARPNYASTSWRHPWDLE
ncbi:hypothetical protein Tco_0400669 [Tanacetum coccineum]